MKNSRALPLAVALAGCVALGLLATTSHRVDALPASPVALGAPAFGDDFWKRWGDGKGELAGYDLVFPRYGQSRKGVAVTIFVTETFSNSLRVKSDPGKHPPADEFPVMKMNLVEDFQTGIYDYNLLTSAFVALVPVNGRPAGSATKVSFSSQEWCGGVYGQLLFDAATARLVSHSYFDGEADQARSVAAPADALSGDAILLWARGLAAPAIKAGERKEVPLVKSIEAARLSHRTVELQRVTLSRDAAAARITVPAGTFQVERRMAEIAGGPTWKIDVEAAEPHRIIAWETSEGERATLLASDRLEYWKLHAEGQESFLPKLGLKPRPPRTP
ncbi:MAG: hypothetical protein ABJC07_03130 [Acidobacteriota bacterium]